MQAEPTDEALMLAFAAGDAGAFEELYSRHRLRLFRHLQRQLRDGPLAEELFQDVWQRVIRLADHWRAKSHRPDAPEDAKELAEQLPDPDTPERALSAFEERRRLQLALEELPPEQREVLLLRLEQELTLEEIGEITGAGRETVKSRLRYAMDKLRARLRP